MHVELKLGSASLYISDRENSPDAGDSVNIGLTAEGSEDYNAWYEKIQVGGEIILPLEKNDFSDAYAIVKDKFRLIWQIIQPKS